MAALLVALPISFMMIACPSSLVLLYLRARSRQTPAGASGANGDVVLQGTSPPSSYTIPKLTGTNCNKSYQRGVVAWEHADRRGKAYMFCVDDNGGGGGMKLLNDKISYISVPTGMKVTVYEHSKYGGKSKTFETGEYALESFKWGLMYDNKDMKDKISSLKIEGQPVNATYDPGAYVNTFDFET